MAPSPARFVYVGTYTRTERPGEHRAEGIFVFQMDPASGALTQVSVVKGIRNPSFLAVHPQRPFLYSVSELPEGEKGAGGGVSAFSLDRATGTLTPLNSQSSQGAGPCHLSVDHSGRYVLVANYAGGSVAILPILADGRLGPASHWVQHTGSSVNPRRQQEPHAHSITPDPTNRFALTCDLGLDKVLVYRLDLQQGKLLANDPPWGQVPPGAGPRHLDFHPNGRWVYVINEIDSTLTTFAYDAARGALHPLQTISTLPPDLPADHNTCADIHVHPSGRFVYGSNRGHDSIAIFAVNEQTGTLSPLGHTSTQGHIPRNFGIDPTGTFLFAANQESDTIVSLRLDPQTGGLTSTGHVTSVPKPVCVRFC